MPIRLPMPHQGQRTVRSQQRRFNFVCAGRRWRKTTLKMVIAVESAMAGAHVIWGAPTYDQCRVGFLEAYRAAYRAAKFNRSLMVAEFPSGGRIIYRSLDNPDNARGHTADGAVLDECGDILPVAWYEVIRPMLMDTGGWLWAGGTPKGRNWFWVEWDKATRREDSMAWRAPTLGCRIEGGRTLVREPHPLENPNIPFTELAQMFETMPERTFRQEILAEFVEDAGGVFRRIREAATATRQERAVPGDRANPPHEYVFGVDVARDVDFTVISVLDATTREQVWQDRFNQLDFAIQAGRIRALHERFRPRVIVVERNSMGIPFTEQLMREGLPVLPFTTTAATKAPLIDGLALAFERGDLRILDDPTLVGELLAYEATRLPSGTLRYGAPEGQHDDCVMALALGYHAMTAGRVTEVDAPW